MIACWGASTIGVAENSVVNKRGKTFDSYRVYYPLGHTGNKEDKILTYVVYGMVLCAGRKKGVQGEEVGGGGGGLARVQVAEGHQRKAVLKGKRLKKEIPHIIC